MTAAYSQLSSKEKNSVRTELNLVPESAAALGTVESAAIAAPPPTGPKSYVFQDGARFQASRQIAGEPYVGKMMVLPAHIKPGTGPCPKCHGTHPEVRECPNVAAEKDNDYNQEYHKKEKHPCCYHHCDGPEYCGGYGHAARHHKPSLTDKGRGEVEKFLKENPGRVYSTTVGGTPNPAFKGKEKGKGKGKDKGKGKTKTKTKDQFRVFDDTHEDAVAKLRNQALRGAVKDDAEAYHTFGPRSEQLYVSCDGPISRFCEGVSTGIRHRASACFRNPARAVEPKEDARVGAEETDRGGEKGSSLCLACEDQPQEQLRCGPCGSVAPMCGGCFAESHYACKCNKELECVPDSEDETDAEVLEWDELGETMSSSSSEEDEVLEWQVPEENSSAGDASDTAGRVDGRSPAGRKLALGPSGESPLTRGARRGMRCKYVARNLVLGVRVLMGIVLFAMVYVGLHGAQGSAREGRDVQAIIGGNVTEALFVLNQSHPKGRLQLEIGFNCRGFVDKWQEPSKI